MHLRLGSSAHLDDLSVSGVDSFHASASLARCNVSGFDTEASCVQTHISLKSHLLMEADVSRPSLVERSVSTLKECERWLE